MSTTSSKPSGRYPFKIERAALVDLSYQIEASRTFGDPFLDAHPEAGRLVPGARQVAVPQAFEAACAVRRAQWHLMRDEFVAARELLATLTRCYRRYAAVFEAAKDDTRAKPFGFLATMLTEALAILGSAPAPDTWTPVLADHDVPMMPEESRRIAAFSFECGDNSGTYVLVEYVRHMEAYHVNACTKAPDPMRTQVTFHGVTESRAEALALACHWAAIGHSLCLAATESP